MARRKPDDTEKQQNDMVSEGGPAPQDETPICKRCGKPITNPHGDNGCGSHTVAEKQVTNCIPLEKNG